MQQKVIRIWVHKRRQMLFNKTVSKAPSSIKFRRTPTRQPMIFVVNNSSSKFVPLSSPHYLHCRCIVVIVVDIVASKYLFGPGYDMGLTTFYPLRCQFFLVSEIGVIEWAFGILAERKMRKNKALMFITLHK